MLDLLTYEQINKQKGFRSRKYIWKSPQQLKDTISYDTEYICIRNEKFDDGMKTVQIFKSYNYNCNYGCIYYW